MLSDGYARHVVSLARARSVLLRTHDAEEMTTQMETAFLVALVLYAVGSLLAPRADTGLEEVDPRVVASLIDPFAVGSYDWAQYTVDVLMESATGVTRNARASQGGTRVYVSGCTAFLNLFYLKNCTDLLQCRPSRRLGPYISLLHGGDLSNAEETSLLQQCLMASHISHLAGSKVQGTCYDDEVNNDLPVELEGGPISTCFRMAKWSVIMLKLHTNFNFLLMLIM